MGRPAHQSQHDELRMHTRGSPPRRPRPARGEAQGGRGSALLFACSRSLSHPADAPEIRQSRDAARGGPAGGGADLLRVALSHELGCASGADGAARRRLPIASSVPASKRTALVVSWGSEHLADWPRGFRSGRDGEAPGRLCEPRRCIGLAGEAQHSDIPRLDACFRVEARAEPHPPAPRSPPRAALSLARERFAEKRASGSRLCRVARCSRYRPQSSVRGLRSARLLLFACSPGLRYCNATGRGSRGWLLLTQDAVVRDRDRGPGDGARRRSRARWIGSWAVELGGQRPALQGREPCLLLCSCSMLPAGAARRRRCRTFTPVGRPGTRVSATRLTRRRSMRSSRSCAHAAHARYGNRLNGLIVVLWRAGLRINEALSLTETDLEEQRGSVLVRHGKNDRRRRVGMDAWGWTALGPWLAERADVAGRPVVLRDRRTHCRARLVGQRRQAPATPAWRLRRASAGASRPTSSAMRTLSSCCARGSRCR